tara:strand:+ start:16 stop:537 length:522 start_codon:yes stop_codon:yes gene_type:complete
LLPNNAIAPKSPKERHAVIPEAKATSFLRHGKSIIKNLCIPLIPRLLQILSFLLFKKNIFEKIIFVAKGKENKIFELITITGTKKLKLIRVFKKKYKLIARTKEGTKRYTIDEKSKILINILLLKLIFFKASSDLELDIIHASINVNNVEIKAITILVIKTFITNGLNKSIKI